MKRKNTKHVFKRKKSVTSEIEIEEELCAGYYHRKNKTENGNQCLMLWVNAKHSEYLSIKNKKEKEGFFSNLLLY